MCLNKTEISYYIDGVLNESEKTQFETHLSACNSCHTLFLNFKKLHSSLQTLPSPVVPVDFSEKLFHKLNTPDFSTISAYFDSSKNENAIDLTAKQIETNPVAGQQLDNIETVVNLNSSLDEYQASPDFLDCLMQKIDELDEQTETDREISLSLNPEVIKQTISELPEYKASDFFMDGLFSKLEASSKPDFESLSAHYDHENSISEDNLNSEPLAELTLKNMSLIGKTLASLEAPKISPDFIDNLFNKLEQVDEQPSLTQLSAYYDQEESLNEENLSEVTLNLFKNLALISKTVSLLPTYKSSVDFVQKVTSKIKQDSSIIDFASKRAAKTDSSLCVPFDDLSAYLDRSLTANRLKTVKVHLDSCVDCQSNYQGLQLLKKSTGNLPEPQIGADFSRQVLTGVTSKEKITAFSLFRRKSHKYAMVAGIFIAGLLATISNPFDDSQLAQIDNQAQVLDITAEDYLFNDNSYRADSFEILTTSLDNVDFIEESPDPEFDLADDDFFIQSIGI